MLLLPKRFDSTDWWLPVPHSGTVGNDFSIHSRPAIDSNSYGKPGPIYGTQHKRILKNLFYAEIMGLNNCVLEKFGCLMLNPLLDYSPSRHYPILQLEVHFGPSLLQKGRLCTSTSASFSRKQTLGVVVDLLTEEGKKTGKAFTLW